MTMRGRPSPSWSVRVASPAGVDPRKARGVPPNNSRNRGDYGPPSPLQEECYPAALARRRVRCGLPRCRRSPDLLKESGEDGVVVLIFMSQSTPGLCWTRLYDCSVEEVVAIHVDQALRHVIDAIRGGVVLASRRLRPVVVVTSCMVAGPLEDVPVVRRCRLHLPDVRRGASGTAGQAVRYRRDPGTPVRRRLAWAKRALAAVGGDVVRGLVTRKRAPIGRLPNVFEPAPD